MSSVADHVVNGLIMCGVFLGILLGLLIAGGIVLWITVVIYAKWRPRRSTHATTAPTPAMAATNRPVPGPVKTQAVYNGGRTEARPLPSASPPLQYASRRHSAVRTKPAVAPLDELPQRASSGPPAFEPTRTPPPKPNTTDADPDRPTFQPQATWAPPPRPRTTEIPEAASSSPVELAQEIDPPQETVLIIGCRGVQVGDDNQQYNRYVYHLRTKEPDFAAVLRRNGVRKALAELALDPANETLRAQAKKELCATRFSLLHKDTLDLGKLERQAARPTGSRTSPDSGALRLVHGEDATILIRHCQGVQIGDHNVQTNEFAYTCKRPQVNEPALLQEHPELADALIDAVVGLEAPNRDKLRSQIDSALQTTAFKRPSAGRIEHANGVKTVTAADGVTHGRRNTVRATHEVSSALNGRKLHNEVKDQARRLSATTRRQRESARRAQEAAPEIETPHRRSAPTRSPRTETPQADMPKPSDRGNRGIGGISFP
ncbi:RIP homotypic interaction motif-containing protein [Streptomyces sp. NPDC001617]